MFKRNDKKIHIYYVWNYQIKYNNQKDHRTDKKYGFKKIGEKRPLKNRKKDHSLLLLLPSSKLCASG